MSKEAESALQKALSNSGNSQIPFEEAVDVVKETCNVKEDTAKQYVYKYSEVDTNVFDDKYVVNMKETSNSQTDGSSETKQKATTDSHIDETITKEDLEHPVGEGTGMYYDGKNIIDAEEYRQKHNEEPPGLEVLEDVNHPLVPDLDYEYLKRRLVGNFTDTEIVTEAMSDPDFATLLEGETGVGKGVLVKYICMKTNRPCIPVNFDEGITFDQLVGHYGPKEDGGFEWKKGFLQHAVEQGYVFLADELNGAPGDVTMALHGVTEDRGNRRLDLREKGEVVRPDDEFIFVGTMNPAHAGYAGAKNLNDAFQTRFYTIEIDYMDEEAEVRHIMEKAGENITEREARRLVDLAGNLRSMYPKEIDTPISTRELIKVAKMCGRLDLEDATKLIFGGIASPTDEDAVKKAVNTKLGDS